MSSELTSLSQTWNIRGSSIARPKSDQVAPVTKPVEVGSMFPGYSKAEELSRGNQGIVYRAIQDGTHRKVAIKLPLYAGRMSEVKRRRFFREIELIARISHPNIVQIFHSGVTTDGAPFYVMDFVDGVPLDQYVREKHLGIEDLLKLMCDICLAMDHAHRQSVVHRDLKPSNILVEPDGKPTIVDFGLAKLFEADREALLAMKDDAITGKQDVIGTMRYMSPEHARGTPEKIEPRSDVYSLGVILYELLTGQLPYPEVPKTGDVLKYMDEFLRHVVETPAELPRKKWESGSGIGSHSGDDTRSSKCPIDSVLETIVLHSLAKEQSRRYQSAGTMAEDIRRYLAGEPIIAKKAGLPYRAYANTKRLIRRHSIAAHVCAVVLAAFFGVMFVKHGLYALTSLPAIVRQVLFERFTPEKTEAALKRVCIVAWKDGTDLTALAKEFRNEGYDPTNPSVKRFLLTRLMDVLVESERPCSTLVLDHSFEEPSASYDSLFIEGVNKLLAKNVRVVVDGGWAMDSGQTPKMSPAFDKLALLSGGTAASTGRIPWVLALAVQRETRVVPSLAVAAYAAYQNPNAFADYRIDHVSNVLEVRYFDRNALESRVGLQTLKTDFIKVSESSNADIQHNFPEWRSSDTIFGYYLHIPEDKLLEQATVDITDVLRREPAALAKLHDRVVVVGSIRAEDNDIRFYGPDRKVAGVYGVAASIDAIIRHHSLRVPFGFESQAIPIVSAAIGSLITCFVLGRKLKYGLLAFFCLATVPICIYGMRWFGIYVDPLVPCITLLLGCVAALAIQRVRVAH